MIVVVVKWLNESAHGWKVQGSIPATSQFFFHDNFPIIKLVGVSALRKENKNGNTWSDIRLK